MRKFYGLTASSRIRDSSIIKTSIDNQSCISSCYLGSQNSRESCGNVKSSVLSNVRCKYIDVEGCILVNVTANRIFARPGCIIYNVIDESQDGLDLIHGQVLAGVFTDDGNQLVMRSDTTIDGGKAWKEELEWNPKTFEDIYNMNTNADPIKIERESSSAHTDKWNSLTKEGQNVIESNDPNDDSFLNENENGIEVNPQQDFNDKINLEKQKEREIEMDRQITKASNEHELLVKSVSIIIFILKIFFTLQFLINYFRELFLPFGLVILLVQWQQ